MKPIIVSALFVLCLVMLAADLRRPAAATVQNPEELGVIHLVNADGSLKSLEECRGTFHSSGSGRVTIAFLGCNDPKSSVRLKGGVPLEFVVRLHKDYLNTKYSLYSVAVMGDVRALHVAAPPKGPRVIPTTATRVGELLKMKTVRPVPPGEYIFVSFTEIAGIKTIIPPSAYLFGVDPPM